MTRTPLSRSKGQTSRSPGRFAHRHVGASGSCSGGRGNVLAVRNCCYVYICSAARGTSAPTGGGEGRGHIVAAARLQLVEEKRSKLKKQIDLKTRNHLFTCISFSSQRCSICPCMCTEKCCETFNFSHPQTNFWQFPGLLQCRNRNVHQCIGSRTFLSDTW